MTKSYIVFVKVEEKPKTAVYEVRSRSSGIVLGTVQWYGPWRKYCFYSRPETVWNSSCMIEVSDFMLKLLRDRKELKK